MAQHFGLGSACTAEVTVRWPDPAGTTETVSLAQPGRFKLEQGGVPERLD